jgi:DNA repair protein RecN (Recombination protein N)
MLLYLTIRDIASISALEIDCQPGMTVITGDSGAGKSIILDALGFVLGDRADAKIIAHDAQLADIHASFDISGNLEARDWLQQRDWLADNECLLRRVLSREGRSRAYINGHPTTLHDLKTLGDKLIDIHSQHAHHALLKKDQQQRLLDAYAGITQQVTELGKLAKQCQHYQQQLDEWAANSATQQARIEWLQHQIDELDSLALAEGEINALDQEQQQLANGEQILQANHLALTICQEGEPNVIDLLNQALSTTIATTTHRC